MELKENVFKYSISVSRKDSERVVALMKKEGFATYSDLFRTLLRERARREGF